MFADTARVTNVSIIIIIINAEAIYVTKTGVYTKCKAG